MCLKLIKDQNKKLTSNIKDKERSAIEMLILYSSLILIEMSYSARVQTAILKADGMDYLLDLANFNLKTQMFSKYFKKHTDSFKNTSELLK